MHWITRTHRGLSVTHRPAAEIPPHALTTFRHACEAFGFLVAIGERMPFDVAAGFLVTYGTSQHALKDRAALRAGSAPDWQALQAAIGAMTPEAQAETTWVYWRARVMLATGGDPERAESFECR